MPSSVVSLEVSTPKGLKISVTPQPDLLISGRPRVVFEGQTCRS